MEDTKINDKIHELFSVSHKIALAAILGVPLDEKDVEKFRILNYEITGVKA